MNFAIHVKVNFTSSKRQTTWNTTKCEVFIWPQKFSNAASQAFKPSLLKMKREKFKTIVYFRQVYLPCLTLFSKCRTYVLMTQPDSHRSSRQRRFYKGLENEKREGVARGQSENFSLFRTSKLPCRKGEAGSSSNDTEWFVKPVDIMVPLKFIHGREISRVM